ncbi:MAG: hypothetical protein IT324_02360 [Anaerolineae bacterium]|nr:hypothetical protein [Anaerolineae bacterium]
MTLSEERLKELLKTAIVELLEERRDLFQALSADVIEDIVPGQAVEEGRKSEFVDSDELDKLFNDKS